MLNLGELYVYCEECDKYYSVRELPILECPVHGTPLVFCIGKREREGILSKCKECSIRFSCLTDSWGA